MNSIHKISALACMVLAAALAGCSSTGEFYLDPEYEDNRVSSTVLIMPVEQSQFPDFYGHTFGSLSTDQKRTFHTDVESLYREFTGANAHVNREDSIDSDSFEEKSLTVHDDTIHVLLPKADSRLNFSNMEPRFILLLDQYRYRRTRNVSEKATYAGHEVDIQYSLEFETNYVYWDTDRGEAVGWGIARGSKELDSEIMNDNDYAEVLQQAVRNIARNGPVMVNP